MNGFEQLVELHKRIYELGKDRYNEVVLYSWKWWLLVCITVVLWGVWLRLVDRNKLRNIVLVGLVTAMLAITLDDIGLWMVLWAYPYNLTSFSSRLNTIDLAVIPVCYMLLYQYFGKWLSYAAGCLLFGAGGGFVVEPLFARMDIYWLIRWEYYYSVPIYLAIGLFAKWLVDRLTVLESSLKKQPHRD